MSRRQSLEGAAALGACAALGEFPGSEASAAEGPKKRTNLLFIFSDQQSHDMPGCYGNEQIITPNIDRFASEGVRFNHCVSNCSICTPYRGILLTSLLTSLGSLFVEWFGESAALPSRTAKVWAGLNSRNIAFGG